MAESAKQRATYADLEAVPPHLVPRSSMAFCVRIRGRRLRHGLHCDMRLGHQLAGPFPEEAGGGPGGWVFIIEPEITVWAADVLVPDIAGWRRERLPASRRRTTCVVSPDWVCEVLSGSTENSRPHLEDAHLRRGGHSAPVADRSAAADSGSLRELRPTLDEDRRLELRRRGSARRRSMPSRSRSPTFGPWTNRSASTKTRKPLRRRQNMPINITMPALSPTMEEGNLAKWLVKEGDKVAPGDVIAEIETDKATMEVEAVDEGTVAKLVVPAGTEGVKVNALIAVLAGEGEDAGAAAKAAATRAGKGRGAESGAPKAEAPKAAAAPMPQLQLPRLGRRPSPPRGRSANGRAIAPSPRHWRGASPGMPASMWRRVTGSGPHGRVVKADVEAAIAGGGAKAAPAAKAARRRSGGCSCRAAKAMSDEQVLKLFEQGSYELVPHDNMRKTIARRLVEAKTTIPHFYLTLDCELDALLALRTQTQCGGAGEEDRQGRGACLQAVGQRHGHQGDGAGADGGAGRPMRRGPTAPWSSTSMPMSASPCRSPAA